MQVQSLPAKVKTPFSGSLISSQDQFCLFLTKPLSHSKSSLKRFSLPLSGAFISSQIPNEFLLKPCSQAGSLSLLVAKIVAGNRRVTNNSVRMSFFMILVVATYSSPSPSPLGRGNYLIIPLFSLYLLSFEERTIHPFCFTKGEERWIIHEQILIFCMDYISGNKLLG